MVKMMTFNELRQIKDSLPDGGVGQIADRLGISSETVRNFFGAQNFEDGNSCGVHLEAGPDGGLVKLDDNSILEVALVIIEECKS